MQGRITTATVPNRLMTMSVSGVRFTKRPLPVNSFIHMAVNATRWRGRFGLRYFFSIFFTFFLHRGRA